MSGYGVDADAAGSRMIELKVLCLSGESLTFRVPCTTLGREVRELVQNYFHPRKVENWLCITALHRLYSIKAWKNKVLWVRLQLCRALLHQPIAVQRGVL
jgi:hypothetical protein